jgi:hypothetical protein
MLDHKVRELTAAGHEALIYDNLSTGHPGLSDGYELIEGNIGNGIRLEAAR